jgi:hypothetical protein
MTYIPQSISSFGDDMFEHLWNSYTKMNPAAKTIKAQFEKLGEIVENDHIAIRTFNHPDINIDKVAEPFEKIGYEYIQSYEFPKKNLTAKHYHHKTDKSMPRIFISQINLENYSKQINDLIKTEVYNKLNIIKNTDLIISKHLWGTPSYDVYEMLSNESEYLGWLYAHGICVNHFTVDTNKLTSFNSLEEVNQFVRSNGHTLNLAGGEIKGSKEVYLEQSSTISEIYLHEFKEGKFNIPSSFYEFSRRYNDASTGKLFQNFIASSADKIFESTNRQIKAS